MQGGASGNARYAQRLGPGTVWLVPNGGVPIQKVSIQAAVDAAGDGDTVELSDGLFLGPGNRDVFVTGKDIRIRSRNGPSSCIIDCEDRGRAFVFFDSSVTSATILQGITITRAPQPRRWRWSLLPSRELANDRRLCLLALRSGRWRRSLF